MNFSKLALWRARSAFMKQRSKVYAQIAFSLEHDATPRQEIKSMYTTAKNRNSPLADVYKDWYDALGGKAAGRVALAMQDTIPATEFALLASAEETHSLPHGLRFLSESVTKIDVMRAAISSAFGKVWLPGLMLIGLLLGVDSFFFPTIDDSLPRKAWPILTKVVASMAHNIIGLLGVIGIVAGALLAIWYFSLSRWTSASRAVAEKTIFYSKYRDFNCALFLVNLAFLMTAEHPPRESLLKIYEHSNPYVRSHIERMIKKLNKDASNLGEAILSTGLFNRSLGDLMANYARWGDWHKQIRKIADTALEDVTNDILRFGPALENGLQLTLGLCVMLIFASGGLAVVKILQATGVAH